jgi:hypothetical protein
MREELHKLSQEVRHAIATRLCADLALNEDDLRAMLYREIEDSIMADPDGFLRESLIGKIKNEIYDEVAEKIQSECRDFWKAFYRNDEKLRAELRSELHEELLEEVRREVSDDLRAELRPVVIQKLSAEMRSDSGLLAGLKEEITARIYTEIKASILADGESSGSQSAH